MLIADIVAAIEITAPPASQAPWDKSGLQAAAARKETDKMAVCLDPSPAAIAMALDSGAGFILSHHPLSLKPALPDRLDNWHECLKLLLGADVPLYAAHTSLDVNLAGPAGWLGRELGLNNAAPLEPCGPDGMGFGQAGDLPAALPAEDFLQLLLSMLCLDCAQLCGAPLPDRIGRVAYCGGSGASLLDAARQSGADIYITGDFKHHAALDAAGLGLAVLDAGHHSLEEEMMRRFAADLQGRLPSLQVEFLESPAPFRLVCQQ